MFQENVGYRPTLDGLNFTVLEDNVVERLKMKWGEEDEVLAAVHSLNGDKALVPDGFTLAFFQKCWQVVKGDLMSMLNQFYDEGIFERSLMLYSLRWFQKKGMP